MKKLCLLIGFLFVFQSSLGFSGDNSDKDKSTGPVRGPSSGGGGVGDDPPDSGNKDSDDNRVATPIEERF